MTSNIHSNTRLSDADEISEIQRKLHWVGTLKHMGEEPYEMEGEVNRVADEIAKRFSRWLAVHHPRYPAGFGGLLVRGFVRFLYLRPGRRVYSPLTSGSSLQRKFCKTAIEELELPEARDSIRKGMEHFVEFRTQLLPLEH